MKRYIKRGPVSPRVFAAPMPPKARRIARAIQGTAVLASALLLVACTPDMDMQGQDPVMYYAKHPIKNTVVTRNAEHVVHFDLHASSLIPDERARMREAFQDISPLAVDRVTIHVSKRDMQNAVRKAYLTRQLKRMGYHKEIMFMPSQALAYGDADITVTYLAVLPPKNCPDWRTSPVTSYSNTTQGNFYCAQEVNTGLMVADPHDLVKGSDVVPADTDRDSKAIDDYNSGKSFAQPAPWDTSGASNGPSSGSSSGPSGSP